MLKKLNIFDFFLSKIIFKHGKPQLARLIGALNFLRNYETTNAN